MKFKCTAYVDREGYVVVDGDSKDDNVLEELIVADCKDPIAITLEFEVPDSLWETPVVQAKVTVNNDD